MGYIRLRASGFRVYGFRLFMACEAKALGFRASGPGTRIARMQALKGILLGGSWVVISGVISKVTVLITHIRGLISPLITRHEPPKYMALSGSTYLRQDDDMDLES